VLKVPHGGILPLQSQDETLADGKNVSTLSQTWPFGYMFPELQDDLDDVWPDTETIVNDLRRLGMEAMRDPGTILPGIPVPAVHTFLGQFIDHDITLERGSAYISLEKPTPLSRDQIKKQIVNSRSPNLDLDNVYGPDLDGQLCPRNPDNPNKMKIDKVRPKRGLPKGKDEWNDLPRLKDGTAQIGDPRDDENIITSQLHVAFLRAHNAIVDRGFRFDEARKLLIQHYQWIVLDDFLERITDPNIVKMIRYRGSRFFDPPARSFYMPLEFSIAAYRFGHSKVRPSYDRFNDKQPDGGLGQLFQFAGQPLPDDWVISWPSFLDAENPNRFPRRIDTSLSSPLLSLEKKQLVGQDPTEGNLAVRNLIRGYILRMPTGQAVAKAMARQGIFPMTDKQILSVANEIPISIDQTQADFLLNETKTDFLNNTPLWFYILAEAAFYNRGHHLGPVGSTIVAEVLIGVLRNSTYSILAEPGWIPTLGDTPGKFDVEDLLKLAGVFS
jgi:hypothetical protein